MHLSIVLLNASNGYYNYPLDNKYYKIASRKILMKTIRHEGVGKII